MREYIFAFTTFLVVSLSGCLQTPPAAEPLQPADTPASPITTPLTTTPLTTTPFITTPPVAVAPRPPPVSTIDPAIQPWILTPLPATTPPVAGEKKGNTAVSVQGNDCVRTTPYEATQSIEDIVAFNPNAGLLWPGSLVQARSVADGVLAGITIDPGSRTPLTLLLTDVAPGGATSSASELVAQPSAAAIEQARIRLISSGFSPQAQFSYVLKEFYSLEQAMFSVGINYQWLSGSVKARLDSKSYSSNNNLVLSFTQRYYTVSVPPPSTPVGVFAPSVTLADLQPYADPLTNPIAYVANVTYGRQALLTVSSTESRDRLKAALEATVRFVQSEGSASLDAESEKVLKTSEVKLLVLGGDPSASITVIQGASIGDQLRRMLAVPLGSNALSFAVPIAYRVNFLRDNTAMRLAYAIKYNALDRSPRPGLRNPKVNFHTNDDDKDDDTGITVTVIDGARQYAEWHQTQKTQYDNNSDTSFALTGFIPAEKVAGSYLRICISPTGRDTWKFNVGLSGDGYQASFSNHKLTQDNTCEQTALPDMPGRCE